jgi:hypothetical protein
MYCSRNSRPVQEEMSPLSGDKLSLQLNRNSVDRLLKWLNSLYRPAVPEEIRARPAPPLSRPSVGASPSGKAGDFDSPMRRFESSRPSQAVPRSGRLPRRRGKGPEIPAFRVFDFVSSLGVRRSRGGNRRKSPAMAADIPVLQRLSAETGSITTAARPPQCNSRIELRSVSRLSIATPQAARGSSAVPRPVKRGTPRRGSGSDASMK